MEKPGETKVETPYEKKIREENDPDSKPPDEVKSPQEIEKEKQQIDNDYRERFQKAYKAELMVNEATLTRLFADKTGKLSNLAEKVMLLSNHLKLTSTKYSESFAKNAHFEVFLKN